MVTTIFPETFFVLGDEFDSADPFRTFPEVPFRDNDPDGAAVFLCKVFTLPGMREDHIFVGQPVDPYIGGVAVRTVNQAMAGLRFRGACFQDMRYMNAGPDIVVPRPTRHAMNIG